MFQSFNCASVMPGDMVIFGDILMRAANELARERKALTKAKVPFVSRKAVSILSFYFFFVYTLLVNIQRNCTSFFRISTRYI